MAERKPGYVWALVQEWLDAMPYPPSQRRLASRLQVSPSTITDWKFGESFPDADRIEALANELGLPYERVLDAFLKDHKYRTPSPAEVAARRA